MRRLILEAREGAAVLNEFSRALSGHGKLTGQSVCLTYGNMRYVTLARQLAMRLTYAIETAEKSKVATG